MKTNILWLIIIAVLTGCAANPEPVTVEKQRKEYNHTSLYYYSMAETAIHNRDFNSAVSLLKKADYHDQENIEIKSRLIDIMSQQATINKELYPEIIELGEDYVSRNLYDTPILLNLAEAYNRTGNYTKAEEYIKLALSEEPTPRMYVSYYIFQRNHYENPDLTLLDKALEFPWKEEESIVLVSNLYKEVDPLKSIAILDSAQVIWDDEELLKMQLALFEMLNLEEEAIVRIEKRLAEKSETSNPTKEYLLGLYFKGQQFNKIADLREMCYEIGSDQALRYLFISELTLTRYDNALETARELEVLDKSPEKLKAMFYGYYSYLLFRKGAWEESANKLILSNDIQLVLNLIAENGFIIDTEEESIEAILGYLELKNVNPDFTNFICGYIYSLVDETEKSNIRLDRISVDYLKANNLLVTVALAYLNNSNDVDKARELLVNREVEDPSFDEVLAQYYYANQMDSLAYQSFAKIISEEAKPELGIFLVTTILGDKLGEYDSMIALMDKGIELYPESAELLNAVGYLIADNDLEEFYPKAEQLLNNAVRLDPENGMIWDSLAWLLFKMGEYEKALAAMKLPLDLGVENSEIAFHLAEIYRSLDKTDKAKYYYDLAVQLDNEADAVVQAKNRLIEMNK